MAMVMIVVQPRLRSPWFLGTRLIIGISTYQVGGIIGAPGQLHKIEHL